ncbi:MAG: beta-ketoacyl-ACP synthase III [Gaiellales bacterium]
MISTAVPVPGTTGGSGVRVGITGTGAFVPERVVGNGEVGRRLGVDEEWIRSRTGIRERHLAERGQATSDLAIPAALRACARAGADPVSIELVIVATASPDMATPATAALVAAAIGAPHAAAYDLSAASTGFVYALAQAYASVASGLCRRVLVIGAEVLSRLVNWDDRSTCILFADAAAAAVVEPVESGGFLGFELGSDGARADDILIPAGGSRLPASPDTIERGLHTIRMNGQDVFRFSTRVAPASALRLLDRCGLSIEDVDLYAPHQSNRRIIDHTARSLGIAADRVLVDIDRFGNTSSASIPLVLDDAVEHGQLRPGDTVLLSAVGAGMTWGTAIVAWGASGAGR